MHDTPPKPSSPDASPVTPLPDPYRVKPGDTLGHVAKRCGQSIGALQRRNGLHNASMALEVGQTVYLSDASAFGFSVLFLDALRHPIENLWFRLVFDGQTVVGKTGANGLAPRHTTESAASTIQVWIKSADGSWQQLTQTVSGLGHKLITLVSPAVVVPGQTRPLPAGVNPLPPEPERPAHPPNQAQPPLPPPATGQPIKNNPAIKTRQSTGPKGEPILHVAVDLPRELLDHFAQYTGAKITDQDWEITARSLEGEPAVLKAIAEVESGGNAFWRLCEGQGAHIPALLYERHCFSQLTKGQYDQSHPDLSWPKPYRKASKLGHADHAMSHGHVEAGDVYAYYSGAYLRLVNAYRLDANAALGACSWGKFQILGLNFKLCGQRTVSRFVKLMCTSEAEQTKLLAEFIRNKPANWIDRHNHALGKHPSLWTAVKTKDWAMIAYNYNGSDYKAGHYDTKLKAAYEKHKALEQRSAS